MPGCGGVVEPGGRVEIITDDEEDFTGGGVGCGVGVLVGDRAQDLLVLGRGRVSGQHECSGRSVVGTGNAKPACQAGVVGQLILCGDKAGLDSHGGTRQVIAAAVAVIDSDTIVNDHRTGSAGGGISRVGVRDGGLAVQYLSEAGQTAGIKIDRHRLDVIGFQHPVPALRDVSRIVDRGGEINAGKIFERRDQRSPVRSGGGVTCQQVDATAWPNEVS